MQLNYSESEVKLKIPRAPRLQSAQYYTQQQFSNLRLHYSHLEG